mgnify:CR=1 FL=1
MEFGMYFLMGVIAPSFLNLIHLVLNIYIVVMRGNILSLGFSGISFLTKSMGMIFLTWLGVSIIELDLCTDTHICLVLLTRCRSICYTTLYGTKRSGLD